MRLQAVSPRPMKRAPRGISLRGPRRSSTGPTTTPLEKKTNICREKIPESSALPTPKSATRGTRITEKAAITPL